MDHDIEQVGDYSAPAESVRNALREEGVPIDNDTLGGEFVWLENLHPLVAALAAAERDRDTLKAQLTAERDAAVEATKQGIAAALKEAAPDLPKNWGAVDAARQTAFMLCADIARGWTP